MMTTTNTTVFKRIGNMLSLIFSDYYEARVFRSSFMRLVTYTVLHRLQAQPRIRQCP